MMDVLKRFKVTDENANLLKREGLDLEVLTDVTEEQLERIGVKRLGQRMKILNAAKCSDARSRACLAVRVPQAGIRKETESGPAPRRETTTEKRSMETQTESEDKILDQKGAEKTLEEKFETFMKKPKTSSGDEMLTTGGVLFTTAVSLLNGMEKK